MKNTKSFLPTKPFDGKMRNVILLSQMLASILAGATIFITTFIYLLVKWTGLSWWFMLLPVVIIETVLVYVNYLARVRYKQYFAELNVMWKKIDRKSSPLALLAHMIIVFSLATIMAALCPETYFFLMGFLIFNTMADMMTVAPRAQCIKIKCPYLKYRLLCMKCMNYKAPLNLRDLDKDSTSPL